MGKTDYFGHLGVWRDYPEDDGHPHPDCNYTYYCEPCHYSRKGQFEHLEDGPRCPHCNGKLNSLFKGQVPWSKKNKLRNKRRKKYGKYQWRRS